MPAISHFKGNRSPSLSYTITVDGTAFDLTGSTVKFRMRGDGSSTLKVDAAATVVTPASGTVRYDWAAADVDTAGEFYGWFQVTLASGKTQDTPEFFIGMLDHPDGGNVYVGVEELKDTLSASGTSYADPDIFDACIGASRAVEDYCGNRRFYPLGTLTNYYSPTNGSRLYIDDVISITTLKTDTTGTGNFNQLWTQNTDFILGPLNNDSLGRPFYRVDAQPWGQFLFPAYYLRSVQVIGSFGWPATPAPVKEAASILAVRHLKRKREVPFGVVGLGLDGSAVRISPQDYDVQRLLAPYRRDIMAP